MVGDLVSFLEGDTEPVIANLQREMAAASEALEFERAARLRDRLGGINRTIEKQQMVTEKPEDLDVVGLVEDELEAAVQVFYVRRGRVVGRKGFIVDKVQDLSPSQLTTHIIEELYGSDAPLGIPREVLVPVEPDDVDVVEEWLTGLRGAKVSVRVPQRGDKREFAANVTRNAADEFRRHKLKRASDHNARAKALNALQDALNLPSSPLRIECYDMSHIQGTDYVGSMVVMEDGIPKPSEYRRFKIKDVPGNDDFAAMEEVLTRRLTALLVERGEMDDESTVGSSASDDDASADQLVDPTVVKAKSRPKRFAYPPQLLLVDGGKGQLSVAVRVLDKLGLTDEIPVASLAKQFEEVYLPGQSEPIRISRTSESLYLLQKIRDEAHRFAITFHRELRGKRMTKSIVDDVAGLGPARKKRLLKELGGVNAVKTASLETLKALTWLPDDVAQAVYNKCHPDA